MQRGRPLLEFGATSPIGLICKYLPFAEAISSAPNISRIACHLRIPTATYASLMPVIDVTNLQPKDKEEYNPPKTCVPRGSPKKKREERATYRGTRGFTVEDMQWENGELVLDGNRLAVRRHNFCSMCGQEGHNKASCKILYN